MAFAKICYGVLVESRKHDHYNSWRPGATKKDAKLKDLLKNNLNYLFILDIIIISLLLSSSLPDSQEIVGVTIVHRATFKLLHRPAFGDAKILLSV